MSSVAEVRLWGRTIGAVSLGDADEIIKVLSLFHGRISQTTITPASEAYLTQLAY